MIDDGNTSEFHKILENIKVFITFIKTDTLPFSVSLLPFLPLSILENKEKYTYMIGLYFFQNFVIPEEFLQYNWKNY